MISYFAVQDIPEDFAHLPEMVTNIIVGRVGFLLNRVIADGLNPMDGTLTVEPAIGNREGVLSFTWTPVE